MASMLSRDPGAPPPRRLAGAGLRAALRDSRARTLSCVQDLSEAQWLPPQQPGVNPVAWELAHLAWFGEFWMLRGPHRVGADGLVHAALPARIAGLDALFDSARLAHAQRWAAPLPPRRRVEAMLEAQLEACLAALPSDDNDDAAPYFHRLVLFHEDMHAEALLWMRAALGHPAPAGLALPRLGQAQRTRLPGGSVRIGRSPDEPGFAFDNEVPGRVVQLPPFDIDSRPVSAGEFLRFVEAGGYGLQACWRGEGLAWLKASGARHPARWRQQAAQDGMQWQTRWFDRWTALDPALPVVHVNAFEAEAYCAWAGRSLPSAEQWEHAATTLDGAGFAWGASVWEWTSDAFAPYPGFAPGPYKDYSQPWFGSHRELRGGACATHARMHDTRYRNFFMPQRTDVFAGFRTASGP